MLLSALHPLTLWAAPGGPGVLCRAIVAATALPLRGLEGVPLVGGCGGPVAPQQDTGVRTARKTLFTQ